jgi:hypothetical protein
MTDQPTAGTSRRADVTAFGAQSTGVWVAALASLGLIIGGVAPWASTLGALTVSGTRWHGWNDVVAGILALGLLALAEVRGMRAPLAVAAVLGALAAIQALMTMSKITSDGAVTLFGVQYRYLDPAWGLYLVLGAGVALGGSATMAWLAQRRTG